jgi:hypothetical protein
MARTIELYLSVLPLVHIATGPFARQGLTEQTLTLFPDKNFATEFYPEQVDSYIELFRTSALTYLVGGKVTGYDFKKEFTPDGLVVVKVVQSAA